MEVTSSKETTLPAQGDGHYGEDVNTITELIDSLCTSRIFFFIGGVGPPHYYNILHCEEAFFYTYVSYMF